jgi:hypothetical protein
VPINGAAGTIAVESGRWNRACGRAFACLWRLLPVPCLGEEGAYAIDEQTAIKVVDGSVEVISEGEWTKLGS